MTAGGALPIPELFDVPVRGGHLRVARWGSGPVVLAAHGITANHLSWAPVAAHLADRVTLVAPDLRGRGGSAGLPGPSTMGGHADDLVAVLDHLDLDSAPVAGHSMGAFVTATMAVRHPDRVSSVVLVDGGMALTVPEGLDVDTLLQAVIGPAMDRLSMTFPSTEAYRDFWRVHPAFAAPGEWNEAVEAYIDYDLGGEPPELRSKVSADAVRGDAADTLLDPTTTEAILGLKQPATFLYSPRGLMAQTPGLYTEESLAPLRAAQPDMDIRLVEGTNHYTILLADPGAAVVAEAVAEHSARDR